jgi:hypothetical protein
MHIRVRQEIPDSRNLGQKIEKGSGMEQSYELKSGLAKPRCGLLPKLFEVLSVVMHPIGLAGLGHLLDQGRELLWIEQVIDDEMRERQAIPISIG